MITHVDRIRLARDLLRRINRADHVSNEGRPTDGLIKAAVSGTMSSGERTIAALALAVLDFTWAAEQIRLAALMRLDNENLREVGRVLLALAGEKP